MCSLNLKLLESGGDAPICELEKAAGRAKAVDNASHWGMKALVGVGTGLLAVIASGALLPIFGAKALLSSFTFQYSAGALGTGAGFFGYKRERKLLKPSYE